MASWLWDFAEINRTPCRRGWTINRNDLDEMMGTSSEISGSPRKGFRVHSRMILLCTSLCHPSRSIQRIAFNNPPWKLKILKHVIWKRQLFMYIYIYIYGKFVYPLAFRNLLGVRCWGSTLCPKIGYGSDKKTPEGIGLVQLEEECVWLK